jgi:predicted MFS family arabinose efflux permease
LIAKRKETEFAMKVLLTILAIVLMAPVLLLVGIALGPAALVILFIVGIALIMAGPVWLVERARSHYARRTRVSTLHT